MKQAIIYARFSPRPNADESMSCELQEQKCREYCQLRGMDILAVFQDRGLSGKRADNRPGLQQALVRVCQERGVLVVYALSRLARSTKDAIILTETLEKKEADLAIVTQQIDTSTPMGRAFFKIMAVIGELERETTAERTRVALQAMQKNGFRVSSKPKYGWMDDPANPPKVIKDKTTGRETKIPGRTIKCPAEQETLALMMRLHKEGLSPYYISKQLNRDGRLNRVGKVWSHVSIKRIIAANDVK